MRARAFIVCRDITVGVASGADRALASRPKRDHVERSGAPVLTRYRHRTQLQKLCLENR